MCDTPIIFLDIHGVMTNNSSNAAFGRDTFDPVSTELLRQLIKETGAMIVITSTLRSFGLPWLRQLMREQGGKKLGRRTFDALAQACRPRGDLINDWRGVNGFTGPYVILDNNAVSGHGAHFLLIDDEHGFKLTDKNNAAEILGVKRNVSQ